MESLLAAVVLAMAVSALTLPFTAAARNEQSDSRRTMAVSVAQELMEEILAKDFEDPDQESDPGPESGEHSRQQFDNIDDYDGFSENAGSLTDVHGNVITDPAATGLSRDVSVSYVYIDDQDESEAPSFARIIVRVYHNGNELFRLTRLVWGETE